MATPRPSCQKLCKATATATAFGSHTYKYSDYEKRVRTRETQPIDEKNWFYQGEAVNSCAQRQLQPQPWAATCAKLRMQIPCANKRNSTERSHSAKNRWKPNVSYNKHGSIGCCCWAPTSVATSTRMTLGATCSALLSEPGKNRVWGLGKVGMSICF